MTGTLCRCFDERWWCYLGKWNQPYERVDVSGCGWDVVEWQRAGVIKAMSAKILTLSGWRERRRRPSKKQRGKDYLDCWEEEMRGWMERRSCLTYQASGRMMLIIPPVSVNLPLIPPQLLSILLIPQLVPLSLLPYKVDEDRTLRCR